MRQSHAAPWMLLLNSWVPNLAKSYELGRGLDPAAWGQYVIGQSAEYLPTVLNDMKCAQTVMLRVENGKKAGGCGALLPAPHRCSFIDSEPKETRLPPLRHPQT